MSEEIIQKGLAEHGEPFGEYEYYNIGRTNFNNLKKYKIIPNKNYYEYSVKAPDALICDRRNKSKIAVVAVIEYKKPEEFNTDVKIMKAVEQCNNYAQMLDAPIGIITDGTKFVWINCISELDLVEHTYYDDFSKKQRGFSYIMNENSTRFSDFFDSSSAESINTINMLLGKIDSRNSTIISEPMMSPSNLAKRVWQAVFVATGDDPKKCLMTFTELFIFKFLSDMSILDMDENGNKIDFDTVYEKGKNHCLKYYMVNVRKHIKSLFPPSEDGTTIINGLSLRKEQNQDELFYNILQSFKDYGKLKNIDPSFKSRLFEDFLKGTTGKKQLAQFFTPRNVIKAIVEMASVKKLPKGSKISDPASGVGGFITESILNRRANNHKDFYISGGEIISDISYYGTDYDELTIVLAKANLMLTLIELLRENVTMTVKISELLGTIYKLTDKSIIGSLEVVKPNEYDLIMSNPPYISQGKGLYTKYIEEKTTLKKYYSTSCVGKEGLFVQKIMNELAPNGEAFIILPDGFFYRPTDATLKKNIIENCFINAIISLPQKTFYATDKKTYILNIQKKKSKNDIQNFPVFMAIACSIGETLDADRLIDSNNDLLVIAKEYKYFKCSPNEYESSEIEKIKTIDFEQFSSNQNWMIENYWTIEELDALGLHKIEKKISEEDFFDNIDYFTSNLVEIKNIFEKEFNDIVSLSSFKTINILDENYIKIISTSLNMTRKEYSSYDTKNESDIPVYTAAKRPVAYFKESLKFQPIVASDENVHISFASDGDGTAGTNVFIHRGKYFINTSRKSLEIVDKNILSEYIYCYLQDMKKKYGFDFRFKANQYYLSKIDINVPIDESGNFDRLAQEKYIDLYKKIQRIKDEVMNQFFIKMREFEIDIDCQLDKKVMSFFNE